MKTTPTDKPKRTRKTLEQQRAELDRRIAERNAKTFLRSAIDETSADPLNAQLFTQRALDELRKLTGVQDAETPKGEP